MIYFIKFGELSYVKIGWCGKDSITDRLYSLQIGSPLKLEVLKTIDGGRIYELELQKRFKKYYVRGEWFVLSDEILHFLNSASTGIEQLSKDEINKLSRKCSIRREINRKLKSIKSST